MAIRTITDLPDVSRHLDMDKFMQSKMEISYKNDAVKSTFESNSVGCDVLVSAVADAINEQGLVKDSTLSASNGLVLTGDVSANIETGIAKYCADLNFKEIISNAQNTQISSSSSTVIAAGQGSVTVDGNSGNVAIYKTATVASTNVNDPASVVNYETLVESLAVLSNELLQYMQDKKVDLPLLGVMYVDHKLDEDSNWKIAGSEVDLTEYPSLLSLVQKSSAYPSDPASIRIGTPSDDDPWWYQWTNNGTTNTLKLPSISCFLQPSKEDAGQHVSQGLPVPAFDRMSLTSTREFINDFSFAYSGTDGLPIKCVTAGNYSTITMSGKLSVSKSDAVYKDENKTVQPEAVKMYLYFYVGMKK